MQTAVIFKITLAIVESTPIAVLVRKPPPSWWAQKNGLQLSLHLPIEQASLEK